MNTQTIDLNLDPRLTENLLQQNKLRHRSNYKKKFRILSGINKEASVTLEEGIYVLGRSESCELIIDDPQVTDQHLSLEIKKNTITVSPLETEMHINGKRYVDQQMLHLFDVVMIGTTSFCLGPCNKAWPKIKKYKKKVDVDLGSDEINFSDPIQPKTLTKKELSQQEKKRQAIKTNRLILPIIMFFGLIIIVFGFGILLPVQAISKTSTPEENINRLIHKENLEHSIILQNNLNNGLEISGYVDSPEVLQQLKFSILNKYPDVKIRVWTTSELLLQAKKIIQSLGANHVDVELVGTGKLAVKGYVAKKSDWEHIQHVLAKDIPSVISIDSQHIYTLEQIDKLLNQHISAKSLDKWVVVDSQSNTIKVTGVLPKKQHSLWSQTLGDFKKQMTFSVEIDDQVIDAKDQKIIIPIKSVSIGDISYLTLKDNSRYIEGAVILDGFVLQAIYLDHIVLSKNNIKYDYYINSEYD